MRGKRRSGKGDGEEGCEGEGEGMEGGKGREEGKEGREEEEWGEEDRSAGRRDGYEKGKIDEFGLAGGARD